MTKKQQKIIRSIYMPNGYWKSIDDIARKSDASTNQVIRHVIKEFIEKNRNKRLRPSWSTA